MGAALIAAPATAETVQSVDDGDTITVRERGISFTIDLDCIDAPELAQRPFGAVAQKRLQALIPIGSAVDLRYVSLDMKGRLAGEVFSKGHNINLVMVRKGLAFAYDGKPEDNRALCGGPGNPRPFDYMEVEAYAQEDLLGVWAMPGGIQRPWDWRLKNRIATPSGDRCQVKRWLFPGALRDPCGP